MSLPFSFDEPLVTERLSLRLMTEDDVDAVHDWMSDPEVVRYQLYDVRDRATVAEKVAEYALASRLESNGDYVQPAIVVDGEVVEVDPPHRLVQTYRMHFDPSQVEEGFTTVTWEITAEGDNLSRLTVTHDVTDAPVMAGTFTADPALQEGGGAWA